MYACQLVTNTPVSVLTTTATFGSIASVISGTASRANPNPATTCMNAAMNTAAPTTISWAVVTTIDSDTATDHAPLPRLRLRSMLPIIDVDSPDAPGEIDRACRQFGFFAIRNHGVSEELRTDVLAAAIDFFGRSDDEKEQVSLARGGPRGADGSRSAAS